MYYVIKVDNQYLGQPKNENYNSDINSWTDNIDEARLGVEKEMNKLATRILKPGVLKVIKVRIFET